MQKGLKKWTLVALATGLAAGVAFSAASSDRLKDTVIIGQGNATNKTVTFDIGAGASNPNLSILAGTSVMSLIPPSGGSIGMGSTAPASFLDVKGGPITVGITSAILGETYLLGRTPTAGEALPTFFAKVTDGSPVIGFGLKAGTSGGSPYLSSTAQNLVRSYLEITAAGNLRFGSAIAQTTAIGAAVTNTVNLMSMGAGGLSIIGPISQAASGSSGGAFLAGTGGNTPFACTSRVGQNVNSGCSTAAIGCTTSGIAISGGCRIAGAANLTQGYPATSVGTSTAANCTNAGGSSPLTTGGTAQGWVCNASSGAVDVFAYVTCCSL
jgi:hypothetical protein